MIRSFSSVIVFILSTFISNAEGTGILKGGVTDSATGEPLPGVYVICCKNLGTATDDKGQYLLEVPAGKVSVTFQFVGYEQALRDLTISRGDTIVVNVSLEMKIREIDQIVISADKIEKRIAELSVSMDVIKSEFLSANHLSDPQEIINKTTGIEVLDGQASVRGGSGYSYGAGSRVMALIDGLPMLSADAGNIKWQYIPLENLSQIEIIKGASSVLYGSSALNGIINFRTSDASNIPATSFFIEGGLYNGPKNNKWKWWDTPRVFSTASFSHLQKQGNTDITIGANFFIDESYRKLNNEKLARINLKFKHYSSRIKGLNYGIAFNGGYNTKTDFVLWEDAETGALKQSPATANEYKGTFLTIDPFLALKKSDKIRHDIRLRLQSTTNRIPESEQNNSDALSLYSEYQIWSELFDFLDITAGLSANYASVISNFFNDHNSFNLAGYGQVDIRPADRLKAVTGVRIEHYSLDGEADKLIPIIRTGLNWQAGATTFIRASFGQGYRFPSIAEKFAATTIGSIRIIANPDLKSESGWSSEIGIKQGILSGTLTGQADLSVFMLNNKNLIEYMFGIYPEGLGFRATNVEQSRVFGMELELMLSHQNGPLKTRITGGYTFMYPVEVNRMTGESTGAYLKYRRKHSGLVNAEAVYKKASLGLSIYIKSKILNIDDVFITTPILPGFGGYWQEHNTGYSALDINTAFRIKKELSISFAVKNLTNTEYMGRPGDIQPPRNYSLRFTGNF